MSTFNNRFRVIGIRYIIGSEPGSFRLGNIQEDQPVLSLKLPESLRASSTKQVSETEPTRVQNRLERYWVSRRAAAHKGS